MDNEQFGREFVDKAHGNMLEVNSEIPYVHAEYERHSRLLKAALVIYTNGDMHYAEALYMALIDSGESVEYYAKNGWDRDNLVARFGYGDRIEQQAAEYRLSLIQAAYDNAAEESGK